jgi:hypothetical protein
MIVCIPTKGRPSTATHKLFKANGVDVYHFVEPQDLSAYDVPNMVDIGANDKGVTYVRNFISNWARANGHRYICVVDDDVTEFGRAKNNKAVKWPDAEALLQVFDFFERGYWALGGINQRQFAWSEKKNYRINSGKVEILNMMDLNRCSWDYREGGKEDRDYLMQCLDNRENFIFFPRTFLSCPAIGTNEGGLHEYYTSGADNEAAHGLCERWGKYAKIKEQFGRVDVKLDYKQKALDVGLKVV